MSTTNHYPAPGERPPHHKFAKLFPMLEGSEMEKFADDLKANGQREPIVLHEGQILDGRNREEACHRRKLEPFYRFFDPRQDGKSPIAFVMSRNLKRRHLTPSQAAAVAAEALPLFEEEAKARQAASGKQHTANLKATGGAGTSIRWTGATGGQAAAPSTQMSKAQLEFAAAVELIHTGKMLGTVNDIISKMHLGHQRAVQLMEELGKAGKLSPGAGVADEHDQRTPESEGVGHEPPKGTKPKGAPKPSKTMAAAIQEAAPAAPKKGPAVITPPPPAAPKEKASDAAGAAVGVSGRSVRTAKKLKEQAPAKFEEVKSGQKTLHAAAGEAEKEDDKFTAAVARIREVCGKSLADAVQEGTRLPKPKEAIAYAALSNDEMLRIRGLIDSGWNVKKALAYKAGTLTRTHAIGELITRAMAGGGLFTLEVEGWRIAVERMQGVQTPAAKK